MEEPIDIVTTILRRQSEKIQKFDNYYAQQKELLQLRRAQLELERVRRHTLSRARQPFTCLLWNRDQRWAQYRSIIAHTQEILNLPAPVADYSDLTFEEIENRFESMGVRKAEINKLYWKEVFHHSQVLFHKVDTWLGSKMVFPTEKPNKTDYLERMGESECSLKVFISAGLEDLQKFDESYAFYKEEFHLRNAHRALERVRYFNLSRNQRMFYYKLLIGHMEAILNLPAPVEDYAKLTSEEARNRMRSVGERSAEMDRLFDAEDKRVQIDFTKKVFIGFHYVITAFIEILEGTEESGKRLKLM